MRAGEMNRYHFVDLRLAWRGDGGGLVHLACSRACRHCHAVSNGVRQILMFVRRRDYFERRSEKDG